MYRLLPLFLLLFSAVNSLSAQWEVSCSDTIPDSTFVPPPPKFSGPPPPKPPPPPPVVVEPAYLNVVDEMPMFPGCEDIADYQERKECADKKMMAFVWGHVKIPALPLEVTVSGTVVVSFIVEKDGSVREVWVVRDLDHGLGDAAVRAVKAMDEEGIRFSPGKNNGRLRRVRYNIPVKFHIGCG